MSQGSEEALSKGNRDNVAAIIVPLSGANDLQWVTVPDGSVAVAAMMARSGFETIMASYGITVLIATNNQVVYNEVPVDHLMEDENPGLEGLRRASASGRFRFDQNLRPHSTGCTDPDCPGISPYHACPNT